MTFPQPSRFSARFRQTLAFRLTLLYAGMFALSAGIAFLFFYLLVSTTLRDRIDGDLSQEAAQLSAVLSVRGIEAVKQLAVLEARAAGVREVFIRLLSPSGEVFSSSNMAYWQDIGISRKSITRLLADRRPVYETMSVSGRRHQVRIRYSFLSPGIILQLGRSTGTTRRFIETFRTIFISTMGVLILLSAVAGWFMARRVLKGVETVRRIAGEISLGAFDKRVPVNRRGDEIDQLAETFNRMLDRIERLVTGMREMSDNIAHDLKSPITRIRGNAEITLTTGRSRDEFEGMAATTIEECDRLLDMINTMLEISRAEAGADRTRQEPMELSDLVHDACELFRPLAEDREVNLECLPLSPVWIDGDRSRVQRLFANILDNAIKYTPAGGSVSIARSGDSSRRIDVEIRDTGIGIAPADLPHVFERFYRCDQSRSRTGSGLGLSLARAIARAHGGDIVVRSAPGKGSSFTVSLPISTPPLSRT
jgi:heavy metal sensor kinase